MLLLGTTPAATAGVASRLFFVFQGLGRGCPAVTDLCSGAESDHHGRVMSDLKEQCHRAWDLLADIQANKHLIGREVSFVIATDSMNCLINQFLASNP